MRNVNGNANKDPIVVTIPSKPNAANGKISDNGKSFADPGTSADLTTFEGS